MSTPLRTGGRGPSWRYLPGDTCRPPARRTRRDGASRCTRGMKPGSRVGGRHPSSTSTCAFRAPRASNTAPRTMTSAGGGLRLSRAPPRWAGLLRSISAEPRPAAPPPGLPGRRRGSPQGDQRPDVRAAQRDPRGGRRRGRRRRVVRLEHRRPRLDLALRHRQRPGVRDLDEHGPPAQLVGPAGRRPRAARGRALLVRPRRGLRPGAGALDGTRSPPDAAQLGPGLEVANPELPRPYGGDGAPLAGPGARGDPAREPGALHASRWSDRHPGSLPRAQHVPAAFRRGGGVSRVGDPRDQQRGVKAAALSPRGRGLDPGTALRGVGPSGADPSGGRAQH